VAGQRRAGDIISTTASIEDIRDKGTGETISVRLSSENQQGELVEETLFTLFVRGRSTGETKPGKQPTASTHSASEPLATIAQRLDEDQTYRYSDASGDRVNIHLDPEVARQAGFPGIIGHGLCTMAFTSRAIVDSVCDGEPERLKRLKVRFALPVIPGEMITTCIWAGIGDGEFAFETRDPRGSLVISDGHAVVSG
jgi:acyl dehydratase